MTQRDLSALLHSALASYSALHLTYSTFNKLVVVTKSFIIYYWENCSIIRTVEMAALLKYFDSNCTYLNNFVIEVT